MFTKRNLKLGALLVGLLVIVVTLNIVLSLEDKKVDPLLKAQGKMLDQLAELSPEELAKIPKRTGIDLAMLLDFKKTKDLELGYVPVERKIEAYKLAKEMFEARRNSRQAIPNVVWNERGPNNVGGRTRALMFDPNDLNHKKVWAGGISGGLWFTNDITVDDQWTAVDNFMSNLAISYITYDPSNTNVFYMGTGEGWYNGGAVRGAGIWKSTDGGANWNQLSSTDNGDFYFTQKIEVLSNGTVLAGTHSGVMKSEDGGQTWTNALSGAIADIEVASDGTIYASIGIFSTGTLRKSTDNGSSWTTVTPTTGGQRIEIAIAPSNPQVLYAVASSGSTNSVAWFRKSIDAGASWTSVIIPVMVDGSGSDFTRQQAWYDLIMKVFPNDPDKVVVGGIDLHMTTDGGTSWSGVSHWYGGFNKPYVHADQHAMAFRPNTNNELVFGNDGGVFYSANMDQAAPTFGHRVKGYNVTQFYACAMANNASNTYLAGAQDNGSHLFTGEGIVSTEEVTGGDGAYCFISQLNPNLMITSYIFNNYYVSTDGENFSDLPGNNSNTGQFINPTEFDSYTNTLYASHNSNSIRRVLKVGEAGTSSSFVTINIGNGQASAIKASRYTANRIYVGTYDGRVFIVNNAHQTPTVSEISNGIAGSGSISSIDVGATDNHLLATISNYGSTSVFESTDGGQNWINKEGNLPDMPVRWGLYNPNNNLEVLLATEVGVWSTSDLSAAEPNWEPTIEGLANVRCDMLKYRASDGQVAIASYGRGLFTTDVFEPDTSPVAFFSAQTTIGYVNTPIQFTDLSLNPAGSWLWTFGDETSSNEQNPSHAYTSPGVYEVKLVIASGGAEKVIANYIQILPNKGASYTLTEGGNFETNATDFAVLHVGGTSFERGKSTQNKKSGTSSGDFAWVTGISVAEYADMSTSYLMTPNFTISDKPTILKFKTKFALEDDWDGFIVEYTTNKGGSWTKLGTAVSSDWYNTTAINEGTSQNVVFTPGEAIFSRNTNNTFQEKMFDISSFSGQDMAFRFSFKTDPASTDAGVVIDDFQIEALNANFEASSSYSYVGKEIVFSDLSADPNNSWSWSFGDGQSSNSQNPTHIYTEPGVYQVELGVDNNSFFKVKEIVILPSLGSIFTLEDGGDLEGSDFLFANETKSGTGFENGKNTSLSTASGNFSWATGLSGKYKNNSESILYFPNFSLEGATADQRYLSFKIRTSVEEGFDGAYMEASTNLGETWTKLGNETSDDWYNFVNNGIFGDNQAIFSGTSQGYEKKSYNLAEFDGANEIAFRLVFKSDNETDGNGIAIDDIIFTDLAGIINSSKGNINNTIVAYPNPVNSIANLSMDNEIYGLIKVNVFNAQGKLVDQLVSVKSSRKISLQINLENKPSGIYIVRLSNGLDTFETKLIKE